jgi:hypothetical protein
VREEEPAWILERARGVMQKRRSSVIEVGRYRGRGSRLQGKLEGLGALGPSEPYDRALEVDIAPPQETDTRVAGRGRDEDRDDGRIPQVEWLISGTAAFEGLEVLEGGTLGRGLFAWEEGIEGRSPSRATEGIGREKVLIYKPDRE